MNYQRIKTELEKRKITIKTLCAELGCSEQGFHKMVKNGSMKVDILEKISSLLGLPVAYWFDDEENVKQKSYYIYPESCSEVREPDVPYLSSKKDKKRNFDEQFDEWTSNFKSILQDIRSSK